MSKPESKPSIFQKVVEAGNAYLDAHIFKAKSQILNSNLEDEFMWSKAVVEDPSYSLHSQGYKEKPFRIQNMHLKQMSYSSSPIAGIIQTRQNHVAAYAKLVKSDLEKGWKIVLKDEDALLARIKEELKAEMEVNPSEEDPIVKKADIQADDGSADETIDNDPEDNGKSDDDVESVNWELERRAREKLDKQYESARKKVEEYVKNCGNTDNRPFETKKWNFEAALRAWTRDSLTYDLYAAEIVPDRAGRPHHWFPVDGGTVKIASRDLRRYKDMAENFYNIDILYPERTKESEERQKAIDLDPKLLEADAYKWVQVVKGKVERAYTADEMKVGIRNVTTDIYNNGYGISELELLVSLVTDHLNAEYYNKAYFTQGFSAKGILHIKAAINRRKLESVRTQWQHMLKGSRNSFQTPIFAGVEDVDWIPLTQSHNDIGFEGWMRYLITMICCIYQIDPSELGIYMKAEGSGGGLSSEGNQKDKTQQSKDKGLYPLLKHVEGYVNDNIITPFDKRFMMEFTSLDGEDAEQALGRQEKEVKFKKTVNEIRAEDGLHPLPGMDDVILDTNYLAWYKEFSEKAKKNKKEAADQQMEQAKLMGQDPGMDEGIPPEEDIYGEGALHMASSMAKSLKRRKKKPLVVEVYKLGE